MNLYLTASGEYVGTQAEARKSGKGWKAETVPTDKERLIAYLNGKLAAPSAAPAPFVKGDFAEVLSKLDDERDEVETDEQVRERLEREVAMNRVDHRYSYATPFSARTILADMDAGNIVIAVKQMHGPALAKVVAACVERLARLSEALR